VLIELDGRRLLTDPVLGQRVAHLRRHSAPVPDVGEVDAVLISHAHRDHLDIGSLRRLGAATRVIAPAGVGKVLRGKGFGAVEELEAGGEAIVGTATVLALPALHRTKRTPMGSESLTVGFRVEGTASVVFFGDTDLFDGMARIAAPDVALLPVWGWGPTMGPGHLDPERAARAVELLHPRIAIPIHWGSFLPLSSRAGRFLRSPGPDFAGHVERIAPAVEVRVLAPGDSTVVDPPGPR
jgi:L-ascorbate metabolism protein UlaG (beta-lactamase superfamily)